MSVPIGGGESEDGVPRQDPRPTVVGCGGSEDFEMNRMDPLAVLLRCPVSVRIVVMICMVVIGLTPSAAARADDLSCPKTTHAIH